MYKCNRCPYSTASHWLLREHELNQHVNDIKIDPKNPKAPTTVSFGPDVAKAPTSVHVSHSVQRGYGVDDDVDMSSDAEMKEKEGTKKIKLKDRLRTRILRGDPRYTSIE